MNSTASQLLRPLIAGLCLGGGLFAAGCATQPAVQPPIVYPSEALTSGLSPRPEPVGPFEGLHRAEAYVKAHPGSDYAVGIGNSMLPLYKEHTVLITEKRPLDELKRGMTVLFVGDQGYPVAHTLVQETTRGWIAMGAGNKAPDRTLVRSANYIGLVVQALEPSEDPMAAILKRKTVRALAVVP